MSKDGKNGNETTTNYQPAPAPEAHQEAMELEARNKNNKKRLAAWIDVDKYNEFIDTNYKEYHIANIHKYIEKQPTPETKPSFFDRFRTAEQKEDAALRIKTQKNKTAEAQLKQDYENKYKIKPEFFTEFTSGETGQLETLQRERRVLDVIEAVVENKSGRLIGLNTEENIDIAQPGEANYNKGTDLEKIKLFKKREILPYGKALDSTKEKTQSEPSAEQKPVLTNVATEIKQIDVRLQGLEKAKKVTEARLDNLKKLGNRTPEIDAQLETKRTTRLEWMEKINAKIGVDADIKTRQTFEETYGIPAIDVEIATLEASKRIMLNERKNSLEAEQKDNANIQTRIDGLTKQKNILSNLQESGVVDYDSQDPTPQNAKLKELKDARDTEEKRRKETQTTKLSDKGEYIFKIVQLNDQISTIEKDIKAKGNIDKLETKEKEILKKSEIPIYERDSIYSVEMKNLLTEYDEIKNNITDDQKKLDEKKVELSTHLTSKPEYLKEEIDNVDRQIDGLKKENKLTTFTHETANGKRTEIARLNIYKQQLTGSRTSENASQNSTLSSAPNTADPSHYSSIQSSASQLPPDPRPRAVAAPTYAAVGVDVVAVGASAGAIEPTRNQANTRGASPYISIQSSASQLPPDPTQPGAVAAPTYAAIGAGSVDLVGDSVAVGASAGQKSTNAQNLQSTEIGQELDKFTKDLTAQNITNRTNIITDIREQNAAEIKKMQNKQFEKKIEKNYGKEGDFVSNKLADWPPKDLSALNAARNVMVKSVATAIDSSSVTSNHLPPTKPRTKGRSDT